MELKGNPDERYQDGRGEIEKNKSFSIHSQHLDDPFYMQKIPIFSRTLNTPFPFLCDMVQLMLMQKDCLLENSGDETSGDGTTTLTEGETLTLLNRHGVEELTVELDVIAGHNSLTISIGGTRGEVQDGGNV